MKAFTYIMFLIGLIACNNETGNTIYRKCETECFDKNCYENSINVLWNEKNSKATIDTIFLGFVLGQSKTDFTKILNSLISEKKLRFQNNDTIYLTGWAEMEHLSMRFHFANNKLDALVLIASFESSAISPPNIGNTNLVNILYDRYGHDDFKSIDGEGSYDKRIFWLKGNTEISYHNWDCTKIITIPVNKYTLKKYCINIIYARKKSYPYIDYLRGLNAARADAILKNNQKKQDEHLYEQRKDNTKDF